MYVCQHKTFVSFTAVQLPKINVSAKNPDQKETSGVWQCFGKYLHFTEQEIKTCPENE